MASHRASREVTGKSSHKNSIVTVQPCLAKSTVCRNVRTDPQSEQQVPHTHEAFESEEIQVEPGIDPGTLIKQVRAHQTLRAKGFVETSQGLRLLQGVGTRIDLIETSVHPPDHLLGRIVVIRRSDNPGSTH